MSSSFLGCATRSGAAEKSPRKTADEIAVSAAVRMRDAVFARARGEVPQALGRVELRRRDPRRLERRQRETRGSLSAEEERDLRSEGFPGLFRRKRVDEAQAQ